MTDTPFVTGPFANQVNFSYFLFLVFGFGLSRESGARASTMDRLAIIYPKQPWHWLRHNPYKTLCEHQPCLSCLEIPALLARKTLRRWLFAFIFDRTYGVGTCRSARAFFRYIGSFDITQHCPTGISPRLRIRIKVLTPSRRRRNQWKSGEHSPFSVT
jgi:hypothetical protein